MRTHGIWRRRLSDGEEDVELAQRLSKFGLTVELLADTPVIRR